MSPQMPTVTPPAPIAPEAAPLRTCIGPGLEGRMCGRACAERDRLCSGHRRQRARNAGRLSPLRSYRRAAECHRTETSEPDAPRSSAVTCSTAVTSLPPA